MVFEWVKGSFAAFDSVVTLYLSWFGFSNDHENLLQENCRAHLAACVFGRTTTISF